MLLFFCLFYNFWRNSLPRVREKMNIFAIVVRIRRRLSLLILEIIYRVTFTCPMLDWKTTNHGPLSAHLLYHHTCARTSNQHPFSSFDVNDVTRNLDCCQNKLPVQVARYIRRSFHEDTLRTWGPRILLLQAFEFVRTSQD